MKYFLTLMTLLLLSGCASRDISKDLNHDIEGFNKFYKEAKPSFNTDKVIVYPSSKARNNCVKKNIKTQNATLKELSVALSSLYDININFIDKEKSQEQISKEKKDLEAKATIQGNISFNLNQVCLVDILDNLTENYNVLVKESANGYIISPAQLRTETFIIDYHNFYRKGSSSIAIRDNSLKEDGGSNSHSSITSASEETFWNSTEKTIRSILSANQEVKGIQSQSEISAVEDFYVYKESGLIVVTAFPKQLKYIRDFLAKINGNSVKQILIETKILEVQLLDKFQNGLQWDVLKNHLHYSSFTKPGGVFSPIKGIHAASGPGFISGRATNGSDFNVIAQAISMQGKISVVSSSRIASLNNQRALIKSGEESYFVTNVETNTQPATVAGAAPVTNSTFELKPFFDGLSLDTTPHILDNNEVLLHIHPMISRVNQDNRRITVDGKVSELPLANVSKREADTVVRSYSGDIIILGGLSRDSTVSDKTGLPINSQNNFIKKVSNIFASKSSEIKRREMIILIKPTIVENFHNRDDIASFDIKEVEDIQKENIL